MAIWNNDTLALIERILVVILIIIILGVIIMRTPILRII